MTSTTQIRYPSPILGGGTITMRGTVYAYGPPCPRCGQEWESVRDPVTGDVINILCKSCYTLPTRFAIDGRPFKNRKGSVGRLFRDERVRLFYTFFEAKRLLEAIRHDWDKGREQFDPTRWSQSGRKRHTLAECSKEWQEHLANQGRCRSHLEHVEIAMRVHILPRLGEMDIREITEDDIEKLQIAIRQSVNPKTKKPYTQNSVKSYLQVLRTLMRRYYERKHVLTRLPAFPEGWSRTPDIDWRTLTRPEQAEIIALFDEEYRLLLEVYTDLGCRPEEVCALWRSDFLPGNILKIQRVYTAHGELVPYTKNKRRRTTELRPDLHARVCALPVVGDSFVFTIGGKPINPNRLSSMFRVRAKQAGYERVTLYSFSKHSLATSLKRDANKKAVIDIANRIGVTPEIADLHYIQRRGAEAPYVQ